MTPCSNPAHYPLHLHPEEFEPRLHHATVETPCNQYAAFLDRKRMVDNPSGFAVSDDRINPQLFGFQRDIVRWALRRGRAAIFADCGLGKTPMQLEWAKHVHERTGRDVLILAPLAVAEQTCREGEKFGIDVTHCRSQDDVRAGVNIANYERLHLFSPRFGGLVLDESSILKGFDGVTRKAITEFGSSIPYRLACTATPAPNDLIELTNHAEFLNVMSGKEIIALFFTQDGNTTHAWRLKGHARQDFWQWMASWSVALRKPSDLGYQDEGFILPPLRIHQTTVGAEAHSHMLFPVEALTMQERRDARRASIDDRVAAAAKLVNDTPGPWVVWCDLNAESSALHKAIPGSVEVKGIPLLLQTPAAVRFVSCEPLLGPVDLSRWMGCNDPSCCCTPWLDWVIVGGESGPKARAMDLAWARSLRDQCRAARVPFFMKQLGGARPGAALEALPEDLRVREWPR